MKIFLLILAILVVSEAQVLGIDFGTEFWKASLISPGKNLVIVENSRSGRKTINGVTYFTKVRSLFRKAFVILKSKRYTKDLKSHILRTFT